jgi:hypothetical protein
MVLIAIRMIIQIIVDVRKISAVETVEIMKVKIVASEDKAIEAVKVTAGSQKEIRADLLTVVIGTPAITAADQTAADHGMMVAIRNTIHPMNGIDSETKATQIAEIRKRIIAVEVMAVKQCSTVVLPEKMMKACANC